MQINLHENQGKASIVDNHKPIYRCRFGIGADHRQYNQQIEDRNHGLQEHRALKIENSLKSYLDIAYETLTSEYEASQSKSALQEK